MYRVGQAVSHNRVMLDHIQDYYLNASVMRSVVDQEPYAIFAQAPVKNSLGHFWEACYHLNIKTIVMLCAFIDPKRGVSIVPVRNRLSPICPPRDRQLSQTASLSAAKAWKTSARSSLSLPSKWLGKKG